VLEELEHANLFVLPLDDARCWYRYHHLFRAFLCARLEREPPTVLANLHRRASAWYQQHQLLPSAVEHALAASDTVRAAELIEASALTIIERGEYATLHSWLERMPGTTLAARPALCLWAAWAALLAGEVERIAPLFRLAECAWQATGDQHKLGELAHLQAHLARLRHDPQPTISAAEQALANLDERQLTLRAGSLLALGAGQLLAGDLRAAAITLADAYTQCQAHNFLGMLVALCCLGDLAVQRGQLYAAAESYQQVIALVGARPIWEGCAAAIGAGDLARERNELAQALELLQPALRTAEQAGVAVFLPAGYIALARTQLARGDSAAAAIALEQALHAARRMDSPAYARRVHAEQARLALAQGDLVAAQRWQATIATELSGAPNPARTAEALIMARVLIAQGRGEPRGPALHSALTILEQLREDAATHGRSGSLIEILALIALATAASGCREQARAPLQQALLLAQPQGYARIFLDEGAPMRSLLAEYRMQVAQPNGGLEREAARSLQAYIELLLAAFPDCRGQIADCRLLPNQSTIYNLQPTMIESISDRELEVLRLIAGGASNQAIATALTISIGTVKSHINHILGKLAAQNRTEAVARARDLRLIAS
jgi:LuxR family maltose regulon positive regulatory protein